MYRQYGRSKNSSSSKGIWYPSLMVITLLVMIYSNSYLGIALFLIV
jgi:hypothetical protein